MEILKVPLGPVLIGTKKIPQSSNLYGIFLIIFCFYFKICFWMATYWANFWCRCSHNYMSTISTFPYFYLSSFQILFHLLHYSNSFKYLSSCSFSIFATSSNKYAILVKSFFFCCLLQILSYISVHS